MENYQIKLMFIAGEITYIYNILYIYIINNRPCSSICPLPCLLVRRQPTVWLYKQWHAHSVLNTAGRLTMIDRDHPMNQVSRSLTPYGLYMFSEDLQFTFSFLSMMYPLILLWIPGDAKSTPKLGKGKEAFRKRKERKERKGNCFHYFPHQN